MTAHEQLRAAICRLIQQARESPVPPEWENQRGAKGLAFSLMLEIVGIENLERAARTGTDIPASDLLQGCAVIRCSQCGCPSVQEPGHDYCQTCARSPLREVERERDELEAALERARQSCPRWCPHREHIDAALSIPEQPKVDPLSDARFAFDVYRAQMQRSGGFAGLPTWDSLKPEVREEWRQAAFKAQRNVTDAPAGRIADLESAASLLVAKLGHRDGREFMARDASLEAHWKELRQLLVACAPAQPATATKARHSADDDCGCFACPRAACFDGPIAAPPAPAATRDEGADAYQDIVDYIDEAPGEWGASDIVDGILERCERLKSDRGSRPMRGELSFTAEEHAKLSEAIKGLPHDNSSNHEDADVCRCGSLMHRDGECDAAERVIVSARRVMELLGTRDGQSFMHRDAALHGHWKELRAAIAALDAAPGG